MLLSISRGRYMTLPYSGRYRSHRGAEIRFRIRNSRMRFLRISANGQYQRPKSEIRMTKYANPGWLFGGEWLYVEWTHFRRHCWHLGVTLALPQYRRGVTLSYGKHT